MNPAQTNQTGLHRLPPSLLPDIVSNIPVHAPDATSSSINEDEELDNIMQAVGNELKKDDNQPTKKRFLLRRKTKQKEVEFSAQPLAIAQRAAPQPAALKPVASSIPKPLAKPLPLKSQPTAPKLNSTPVFTVFVTAVVTVVLIAAAIAAYKK
jgi:hypothetical protein